MKPENILVSSNNIVKIADFGLSRTVSSCRTALTLDVVTLWYRAPELLLGNAYYDQGIDIWSAGCIFIELTTRFEAFQGKYLLDQLYKIFQTLGTPTVTGEPIWDIYTQYFNPFDVHSGNIKLSWLQERVLSIPDLESGDYTNWRCDLFPQWFPRPWSALTPHLDSQGESLLSQMLCYDRNRRINAVTASLHPFLCGNVSQSHCHDGDDVNSACTDFEGEEPELVEYTRSINAVAKNNETDVEFHSGNPQLFDEESIEERIVRSTSVISNYSIATTSSALSSHEDICNVKSAASTKRKRECRHDAAAAVEESECLTTASKVRITSR